MTVQLLKATATRYLPAHGRFTVQRQGGHWPIFQRDHPVAEQRAPGSGPGRVFGDRVIATPSGPRRPHAQLNSPQPDWLKDKLKAGLVKPAEANT
jgi:hypothetical protein